MFCLNSVTEFPFIFFVSKMILLISAMVQPPYTSNIPERHLARVLITWGGVMISFNQEESVASTLSILGRTVM